jgi:hypothetical protein
MRYEEYIKNIMESFKLDSLISPDAFPRMDLYNDQVTGFLNEQLKIYEVSEGDPVITKTMVSNCIKNNMLPKPDRKKYSRDHMILMAMIFYLKSTFQMSEIKKIIEPFVNNYGSAFDEKFDFHKLYEAIFPLLEKEREESVQVIQNSVDSIKQAIWDSGVEDDDATELLFMMLYLAVRADAAKFTADKMFAKYFTGLKEKPRKKRAKAATDAATQL